jgi:hypothetical protein
MAGDASLLSSGAFAGFIKGTWDRNDPSYARPLSVEKITVEKW